MNKGIAKLLILFIVFFASFAYPAGAATELDSIKYTSSGNAFGGGDRVQINQDIQGDLVLAGSALEINGKVGDDFTGAGGDVVVNGNVSGNIIAAGGSIKVNGNVGGDVAAFGGQILLSNNSIVNGDVLLAGGDVTLNGIINGNGDISAGTLHTGENFKLNGNLSLQAENYPANLNESVAGTLNVTKAETETQYQGTSEGFSFFWFILGLIAALALGLILIYLFPNFITGVAELIRESPLKTGLIGFLILIFVPILAVVLLITIFGWSVSVFLLLLLALTMLIATIPVKMLAGKIIYNGILKKEAGKMLYYLIGTFIFALAYEIPIVGGLIRFVAVLIGVGAIGAWLALRARSET